MAEQQQETRALMVIPLNSGEARVAMIALAQNNPRITLEVDGKSITLDEWEWDRITESMDRMFALAEAFSDFSTHGSGGNDAV